MTDTCEACRAPIGTKPNIRCKKCSRLFHLLCVDLPSADLTNELKSKWICTTCHSKTRKGNSNTPVQSTSQKSTSAGRDNVTLRAKNEATHSPKDSSSEVSLILAEVRLLRQDMNDVKHQLKEATERSNQRMDEFECMLREHKQRFEEITGKNKSKMDEFDLSLYASVLRITGLEEAQPDVSCLNERISKLEEAFQIRTQQSLRNELEIVGVPEAQNESLTHIIRVAATKIGEDIQEHDLDWVERVGPRPPHSNKEGQRSRLIVVRFVRRDKRDAFLKAAKARRNVSSSDFNISEQAGKVYFNERLTKSSRQIFQAARRRTMQCGFKYCWTRNGAVFIRKEDGRPAIPIRSHSDLDRHLMDKNMPRAAEAPYTLKTAATSAASKAAASSRNMDRESLN